MGDEAAVPVEGDRLAHLTHGAEPVSHDFRSVLCFRDRLWRLAGRDAQGKRHQQAERLEDEVSFHGDLSSQMFLIRGPFPPRVSQLGSVLLERKMRF
jgi:hypothetical protein